MREKEQLSLKICMALQIHTRIEEEIFYPAAREAIEKPELIDEASSWISREPVFGDARRASRNSSRTLSHSITISR